MVLLAILMAFERKARNAVFEAVISDFPTLIFVEFMLNSDKRSLSIRKVVNFYNFSEDPASLFMFAIDKHIFFNFIIKNVLSIAEMACYEEVEIGW